MAKKVKNMLKNNMVLCVLILVAIGLTSVVLAADFKVKEGAIEEGVVFGSWTDKDSESNAFVRNEIYKAQADGFVLASCENEDVVVLRGYMDSNNPPTTKRLYTNSHYDGPPIRECITLPVKKDDYWKLQMSILDDSAIYWIPIGNGGAPVKQ